MDSFEFQFPRLERVTSGVNVIDSLAAEIDRRRLTRVAVVTGHTLGASALLKRITDPLGARCVLVFKDAKQHVPSSSVVELALAIDQRHADCVISFGGGSPIDTVKAAIHTLLTAGGGGSSTDEGPVHIAIPTTLSAGEFTAVLGITDERTRVKRAVSDPRLVPRTVYTDPTLTLETPPWLWAASGVRALDHAVETTYASRPHPLGQAAAARGLSMLLEHLPASLSTTGVEQLEHRLQCQMGAWLSVFGIGNAGLGLSHALGHQIGPRWNVAHGVTSCITLPHAMRYMAMAKHVGISADSVSRIRRVVPSRDCNRCRSRVRRSDDALHCAVRAAAAPSRRAGASGGNPRGRGPHLRHPRERARQRVSGHERAG